VAQAEGKEGLQSAPLQGKRQALMQAY